MISAVTFAYNEEKNIGECLQNLSGKIDEIIVVDMDSTDKTAEIAYKYTREVYKMPHLICGDYYKNFLVNVARGDWILWFYPDERFSDLLLAKMPSLCESMDYDAYAVMRHEYRDGIRLMPHGTQESPNYQNRLHRKGKGIYYTELVHAELHGRYKSCGLPPEFHMEHRKTDVEQGFDNWRTYVEMRHLLWKYRDTKIDPYKTFCDSYRQIIHDSEAKNADGSRDPHLAEEHWWHWWNHRDEKRCPRGILPIGYETGAEFPNA